MSPTLKKSVRFDPNIDEKAEELKAEARRKKIKDKKKLKAKMNESSREFFTVLIDATNAHDIATAYGDQRFDSFSSEFDAFFSSLGIHREEHLQQASAGNTAEFNTTLAVLNALQAQVNHNANRIGQIIANANLRIRLEVLMATASILDLWRPRQGQGGVNLPVVSPGSSPGRRGDGGNGGDGGGAAPAAGA